MSRKSSLVLALALAAAPIGTASAQVGVAGRIGTLGLGGEVAVDLGNRLVLRGGVGVWPVDFSGSPGDLDVTLELPTWFNVGLDAYLNGAVRVGGGILFKKEDPRFTGEFTADQEIGGQTFTPQEIGTLIAVIDSRDKVPYALIGFGKHTAPGVGLFVDFGVAFLGSPSFLLSTEGGTLDDDSGQFRAALDAEAQEFEEDSGKYLEFWPILNIGLRIGVN
jgi:hypothetical protein